jgi:hypothetical protein
LRRRQLTLLALGKVGLALPRSRMARQGAVRICVASEAFARAKPSGIFQTGLIVEPIEVAANVAQANKRQLDPGHELLCLVNSDATS